MSILLIRTNIYNIYIYDMIEKPWQGQYQRHETASPPMLRASLR